MATKSREAPQTGTIASSTNPLELGGDSIYGQYFGGLIDEVRIYNVARTAAEIQTDMSTPIVSSTPSDSTPPSAPGTLGATASARDAGRPQLGRRNRQRRGRQISDRTLPRQRL